MKKVGRLIFVVACALFMYSCAGLQQAPAPAPAPVVQEQLTESEVATIGNMAVEMYVLQRSYDSLLQVNKGLRTELAVSKTIAETTISDVTEASDVAPIATTPATTAVAPAQNTVAQNTVAPAVQTATTVQPPVQQYVQQPAVQPVKVEPYMLVFSSFTSFQNASSAVRDFSMQYPVLSDRVSVVPNGEKFRVGFVDFASRESALVYKDILVREFPEFATAWPCKIER